jgi:hypothetical protein
MLGCLLSFAQSSICSVNPSFSQKQNGAESNLSSIFFVCAMNNNITILQTKVILRFKVSFLTLFSFIRHFKKALV